jgi:hypothetical protein
VASATARYADEELAVVRVQVLQPDLLSINDTERGLMRLVHVREGLIAPRFGGAGAVRFSSNSPMVRPAPGLCRADYPSSTVAFGFPLVKLFRRLSTPRWSS